MMRGLTAGALCFMLALPASGVIVREPVGAPGASAPFPVAALRNVAIVAGLSGVYLGKGWILTAGHVLQAAANQKKNGVLLDGQTHLLLPDTEVRLSVDGEKTDLALVRIDGAPALDEIEIVQKTPPVGARLLLAGNGPLQETKRTCWDGAAHEVAATTPGARCGFKWWKTPEGRTNGLQWGTGQLASSGAVFPGPGGTRTRVFGTVFRDAGATAREAQAGVGDSGGPVFLQEGKNASLAGILLGVSAQHPSAAIFGDRTWAADLSLYRDAIRRVLEHE